MICAAFVVVRFETLMLLLLAVGRGVQHVSLRVQLDENRVTIALMLRILIHK